jgi:hypothetical protein
VPISAADDEADDLSRLVVGERSRRLDGFVEIGVARVPWCWAVEPWRRTLPA